MDVHCIAVSAVPAPLISKAEDYSIQFLMDPIYSLKGIRLAHSNMLRMRFLLQVRA